MKTKQIRVTAEDIALGEPGSFCDCPVARAVRRAWRTHRPVTVRHEGIFVGELDDGRDFWMAALPPDVDRFIEKFDRHKKVKPMAFAVTFR